MRHLKLLSLALIAILFFFQSSPSAQEKGARIRFEKEAYDFGKISEDKIVEHTFKFFNDGDAVLEIKGLDPSCGCTEASVDKKIIEPGQSGEIKATLNPIGKRGKILKSISVETNDKTRPEIILRLDAQVFGVLKDHPQAKDESIFSEKCAKCHVARGAGKLSRDLYLADCAFCHGDNGEGKSARALNNQEYLTKNDAGYIKDWIANGKDGSGMPGFSKTKGGPLDDKQVESLVSYITKWKKKERAIDTSKIAGKHVVLSNLQSTHEKGKVKMTVFFDFYCGHCFRLYMETAELVKKYGKRLEVAEIGFPLWDESFRPIEAYEIAKDLGKGRELKDKLFKLIHWDKMKISTSEVLSAAAGSVGIDPKLMEGQLKSGAKREIVLKNASTASRQYDIKSTPTVIFDNQIKATDNSIPNLEMIIESLLKM
jgi:predicted DsbA family dithiol-disulfide isomerase/mono/diheme cytochrome c family protein